MAKMPLRVLALNCSLKSAKGREKSSTDVLLGQLLKALEEEGARGEILRVADLKIKPGVKSDMGRGDGWPRVRQKLMAAHILIIGSPIWLGQQSSLSKMICERLSAFIDEKDDLGRTPAYGKVGAVAVVGNEDGAHHVIAELHAAMNEVGFTIPAAGSTYWVGEALEGKDYKDLVRTPRAIAGMTRMLASNTAQLARALVHDPYPGVS